MALTTESDSVVMESLSELASICRLVESEKVTERKVVGNHIFTNFLHYLQNFVTLLFTVTRTVRRKSLYLQCILFSQKKYLCIRHDSNIYMLVG